MARQPTPRKIPPVGVHLSTDVETRAYGFRARVRWTDPTTKERPTASTVVRTMEEVEEFFAQMRRASENQIDPSITLSAYIESLGDRWTRGLDQTSTVEGYEAGLRLRVLPALGHIAVAKITPGMIDRTIDTWEEQYSPSVIKNTVSPLVRVLAEAVRDEIVTVNPADGRARRTYHKAKPETAGVSPRAYAIKDLKTLNRLADACGEIALPYHDYVMLAALLSARSSEVAGLRVGDVHWDENIVWINRQTYPGKGGLVDKATKGRERRPVPILKPLIPVLQRLTEGRAADERLLLGPRGGVLTTATVRDATGWDTLVQRLQLPDLTRHGLRHTGATWMADAGVPLHVLQRILGHKSIETTKLYLHPDLDQITNAGKQASRFLIGGTGKGTKKPPAIELYPPTSHPRHPVSTARGSSARADWSPNFPVKWATSGPPNGWRASKHETADRLRGVARGTRHRPAPDVTKP